MISKLKLKKFIPVENAGIQSVYNMVETHALHKDTLVKVEDETLPDMERMKRKLGDRSQEFLQEVYQEVGILICFSFYHNFRALTGYLLTCILGE